MRSLITLMLLASCGYKAPPVAPPPKQPTPRPAAMHHNPLAVAGVSDAALKDLLHLHWEAVMASSPAWATQLGDHRFDGQWRSADPAEHTRVIEVMRGLLSRAIALDPSAMSSADQVTRALFIEELTHRVDQAVCQRGSWSFSPRMNPVVDVNQEGELFPMDSAAQGALYLSRLSAWTDELQAHVQALRGGISTHRVSNAHSTELVVQIVDDQLALPTPQWPLMAPTRLERPTWTQAEREDFDRLLFAQLDGPARVGLQQYRAFLHDELLPVARNADAAGLLNLPDGEACYASLVRQYTTLPLTADDIHHRGLDALAEIHGEFRVIGERALEEPDLQAIFHRLRTDPDLFFETEDQVEAKAVEALARARAAMPEFFGVLPEADCVVRRIPDYEAPYTTIAYYRQLAPDGSKPGEYFINTYAPTTRPRHEAEVLAYHESIPGHHLQIAIAYELPQTPAFRRFEGQTVFVEGWALYTERLADEMGLYSSDVDRLGMLSFDAWRAARLVVDTGIHAKGWTRAQAEAFMVENTPLAENNIRNEVDRYITWPGQALAYKTGQLEIWRLRRDAEDRLGDGFSLPDFHDTILGGGTVSLPVLRDQVEAWVIQETAAR